MSFGYGSGPSGPMARYQDGQLVPYQPSNANTDEAYRQAYGMTGIPDMQQAYKAYQRGEYLPALGQGAWGAAQAAGLAAPVAGGALRAAGGTRNALGMLGEVLADESGALRLYHGSPYSFNRFRSSQIGSGEGAQAYGHGLYFAEAEPVAESYLKNARWQYGGRNAETIYNRLSSQAMERGLDNAGWDNLNAQRGFWEKVALGRAPRSIIDDARANPGEYGPAELSYIQSLDPAKFKRTGGNMYEVNVDVDPQQLLDWDKPLVAQSEPVKQVLANVGINQRPDLPETLTRTGGDIYERLTNRFLSDAGTSRVLEKSGIPGIRYLDQGSRSGGQGTSNYVVFNDKLIDILRKYGIAGPVVGAGAMTLPGEDGGGF